MESCFTNVLHDTNTYLLIFYISPNYKKLGEPQTDHLVERRELRKKARSPPKIKGNSLNLRR